MMALRRGCMGACRAHAARVRARRLAQIDGKARQQSACTCIAVLVLAVLRGTMPTVETITQLERIPKRLGSMSTRTAVQTARYSCSVARPS
jgi:hypothetical protein